jgi:putative hydrolase of the HAD superfamily
VSRARALGLARSLESGGPGRPRRTGELGPRRASAEVAEACRRRLPEQIDAEQIDAEQIDAEQIDAEQIDAVVLDAGGVLVLPDPEALREALAPLGAVPDDETCRLAHFASMRELDRLGRVEWRLVNRTLASVAGVPAQRLDEAFSAIEETYLSRPWVPAPGAAEALRTLEAAGFGLAVVSNASGTVEDQLRSHGICRTDANRGASGTGGPDRDDPDTGAAGPCARVAVVVDSHLVGVEKPDPAIFELALAALGVDPERSLYVGDTVHFDVRGARAAGLAPVHVDPYGLCPLEDHAHTTGLPELAAALAAARTVR